MGAVPPASRRVVIGGIPVTALSQSEWGDLMVADCLANRTRVAHRGQVAAPKFMTSANGYVLSLYARDREFQRLVDAADAVDADGMPLVVASRLLARTPLPERVATSDFFHVAAARAEEAGLSFFLLGGDEEVNRAAVAAVQAAHPRLRIAGRHHGFFALDEEPAIARQIVASGTDVLWVGMGAPYEHRFIVRNRSRLTGVSWIKSCGGLFKFIAGTDPRAPQWMHDLCLEWLFRLAREPRRLFPRYFRTNGHAIYLMYKHRALTRDGSADGAAGATASYLAAEASLGPPTRPTAKPVPR